MAPCIENMPAVVIQEWTDMTQGWTFFAIFRKKVRPNVPELSTGHK
jgi:hypothetical protein